MNCAIKRWLPVFVASPLESRSPVCIVFPSFCRRVFSYNGTIRPLIHQREPLLLLANAAVFSYFCRFCCSANLIFTLLILGVWLLVPKRKKRKEKKNTKERFMCTCRIQLNWRKRGKCSSHILQIYIILQSLYFPALPLPRADACLLPFSPNVKKPFTIERCLSSNLISS